MSRALLGAALLALAACASAPPEPQFLRGPLKGRLAQGVYHDPHDWFGISTPIAPGDPDYATLVLDEQSTPAVSLLNFALSKAPGEYYRVYVEDFAVGHHPVPNVNSLADSAMKFFGTPLMQNRLEPVHLVEERPWQAGATGGVLRLYTERTPSQMLMGNLGMAEDYTAYILMYVTSVNTKVAVLWMEWPDGCAVCMPPVPGAPTSSGDPIERALAANGRSSAFMNSFHYGPN